MNRHRRTYHIDASARLGVLRGLFLAAGILLGFPAFQHARRVPIARRVRTTVIAVGSHHTSPAPTPDKRCDVDGSGVIVSSNWSLAHSVSPIAQHFPALPEKLSFLHLSSLTLRGPPTFET